MAEKKSKKGLFIGLTVGALALVAGVVGLVVGLNSQTNPTDPKASLSYSEAFFIGDGGKYTLWNAEGKRLTEDEYDYKSDFIGGHAYVKKGDQVGVVDENGKMTIELGKYGSIVARGGLYLAQDGNTKTYYLLTGSGKELLSGDKIEVNSYGYGSAFAAAKYDGKLYVYTYDGKLVFETEVDEDATDAKLDSSYDFGAFYYNGKNVIFDTRSGKILANFDDARYTFEEVATDRAKVLLQNYDDSSKYKLIVSEKIYDLNEMKYYSFTALNDLIGYDSYSEIALLNDEYKVVRRVDSYLALKDYNNFATANKDGNVEIYYNGENIKTFTNEPDIISGVLYENYYAIGDGDVYKFYNLDGTVGIEHSYKEIRTLFDKHHHAIVSDETSEYYLIDNKGNRIGEDTARQISVREGGYEFRNIDSEYAIGNKKGELVTDYKYESTYYRSAAIDRSIWTGQTGDNSYDVIDADSGKVLLEGVNVQSFYANYFTVKNSEGKTEYYTYEGELFYTAK